MIGADSIVFKAETMILGAVERRVILVVSFGNGDDEIGKGR